LFSEDDYRQAIFSLVYSQYGGSGMSLGYRDVMEMDFSEMLWFIKTLNETRENEADQLKKIR
jgi:hypothetical protein